MFVLFQNIFELRYWHGRTTKSDNNQIDFINEGFLRRYSIVYSFGRKLTYMVKCKNKQKSHSYKKRTKNTHLYKNTRNMILFSPGTAEVLKFLRGVQAVIEAHLMKQVLLLNPAKNGGKGGATSNCPPSADGPGFFKLIFP